MREGRALTAQARAVYPDFQGVDVDALQRRPEATSPRPGAVGTSHVGSRMEVPRPRSDRPLGAAALELIYLILYI
jgi:hypothetical protein